MEEIHIDSLLDLDGSPGHHDSPRSGISEESPGLAALLGLEPAQPEDGVARQREEKVVKVEDAAEEEDDGSVFRSMTIAQESKTPYSDATQVIISSVT